MPEVVLDHETCYRALRTRDPRFDGRFFTGVHTTGIYCRPICPARTPRASHVDFYACAAAAEEAGFRPCKRCRPETAPGTPAWLGTSSTVTRALRLIGGGALDQGGHVDELAERLGVTARHLRRLFDEHLGASPIAVAQARRVHFAKTLLENSQLPITEVAFASGFASVRRFNTAFSKTFQQAPRDVRRSAAHKTDEAHATGLELHLAYREPFDYDALLGFLARRATPGVEEVKDGRYRRAAHFGRDVGVIEVARDPQVARLRLRISVALAPHALPIVERTRRLFDLSADSWVIEEQLARDPELRPVVQRFSGTRVPGAWDGFETAVRAVVGQQVSVKGATTLSGRMADAYGTPIDVGDPALDRLSPTPEALAKLRAGRIGLTKTRAQTLRQLARSTADRILDFDGAASLEQTVEALGRQPGLGPWSAHYIAMRAFGEPDAFPAGDLVLRKMAARLDPELESQRALEKRSERWRPWRAYAAMMLWRLAGDAPKSATRSRKHAPRPAATRS